MINILYEDNHVIAVLKPINVPTQKDFSNDMDMHSLVKEYLRKKYNKPGNVYLGLLHRLDRPVSGVMIFAKTSKAASRLAKQIKNHEIRKVYYTIVEGVFREKTGTYNDKLLKNKKENMVKIDKSGKEALLNYEVILEKGNYSLVKVELVTGRSHQIRVQFASRKHPLYGDQKYNKNDKKQIALFCSSITFYHPITKEEIKVTSNLPKTYPWTMFEI